MWYIDANLQAYGNYLYTFTHMYTCIHYFCSRLMTLKIKGRKLPRLPQKRRNKHFNNVYAFVPSIV